MNAASPAGRLTFHAPRLACLTLFLFFAAQLVALNRDAPTVDEPAHLARGYSYLRTGDLRLHIGHPPLVGLWAALPLLFDPTIQLPLNDVSWQTADWIEFPITLFWKIANPASAMFRAGRVMIILLGLLFGAVLYRFGADLGGPALGLAALTLAFLDPNLRAHARLITTDLGVTLWLLACLWLTRRLLRHPSRPRALAAGGLLGLALASKFTALAVVPLLLGLLLWEFRLRRFQFTALYFSATALSVWAVYGFELRPFPLASYLTEFYFSVTAIAGTPTYLLGQVSRVGFYQYFLIAFLVKAPLPLIVLSLAIVARPRVWRSLSVFLPAHAVTWLPLAWYLLLAILARVNIGYRHIFPVWPLLYLAGGATLVGLAHHHLGRWLAGLALGWLIVNTLIIYPRELTFFNELAGGPAGGARFLVDSNLDWGQDLDELIEFLRANTTDPVYLSYFGAAPVAYLPLRDYDFPFLPLPPAPTPSWQPLYPAPGWYAISLTHLKGAAVLDNPDTFAFFQHQRPTAIINNTLYVYHLLPATGTVAACSNPAPSLTRREIRRSLGLTIERILLYDCTAGLPLPTGPTWYLLRGEQSAFNLAALTRLGAELVYAEPHRADNRFTYQLYYLADPASRAATYPEHVTAPQTFGGLATFLGYGYATPLIPDRPAQVETVWRIEQTLTAPLSIFLHLSAPDGFPYATSDGWNMPFDFFLPGDALIQFHPLIYPADLPADTHWTIGLYALTADNPRYLLPDGEDKFIFLP